VPKTAAAAVPAFAQAAGQVLGLTNETINSVMSGHQRAPGQLGVLAIDPGDKHVGVALGLAFAQPHPETGAVVAEDELFVCWQMDPVPALNAIDTAVNAGWVDILVIEDWRVYPDKATELVGSRCETARFLGAVEHLVRKYNRMGTAVEGHQCELVEQPAIVQAQAKAKLREYKMDRTSKPNEPHALSAELHFWFLIFNRRRLID
jgi:hypothetical protein